MGPGDHTIKYPKAWAFSLPKMCTSMHATYLLNRKTVINIPRTNNMYTTEVFCTMFEGLMHEFERDDKSFPNHTNNMLVTNEVVDQPIPFLKPRNG